MAFRATYLAVLAVTLLGQFAAVGFEVAAAARFGTGREADVLAFALILVTTLTAEAASWVSTLVIPLYLEARAAAAGGGGAFLRRVLAGLVVVTGAAAATLAVAAPGVVRVLAPALGESGVTVLRGFAPLLVLVPLAALFAAALQAHGRFVAAGARQLAWYGGGLAALVVWAPALGVVAVPLGMLAGSAVFAVLLGVSALRATRMGRAGSAGGPSLIRIGTLLVPLAIVSAAAAVNVAVERALAARLPEGSLAALTYAYRLMHFPLALFVANATAMLLPRLAAHAVREEGGAADALTVRVLRVTLVFAVPLAVLAMALAEPITAVLLERGAFTPASTATTATAIVWYAPAVVGLALSQVLVRVYQARRILWRLAAAVGGGIAVNIVLMGGLTAWLGFRGLALASSLSALALVVLMLRGLRHDAPGLRGALSGRGSAAVVAAGLAAFGAAWLARTLAGSSALTAVVAGGAAGLAIYAAALLALAPGEARAALALLTATGRTARTVSG